MDNDDIPQSTQTNIRSMIVRRNDFDISEQGSPDCHKKQAQTEISITITSDFRCARILDQIVDSQEA